MSDIDWHPVAVDLTNCLERRNARIRELEAALQRHHATMGCINYCRTCGEHFDWQSTPQKGDHFYEPVDEAAQDKTLRVIANMVPQKGTE